MSLKVRSIEWINHNSQRAYPLAADATGKDTTGAFELPDEFLVGLQMDVPWSASIQPAKFFVRRILSQPGGFAITVGYAAVGGDIDVAEATIPRTGHTSGKSYFLYGKGVYAGERGRVTIGRLEAIDDQPGGDFTFDIDGGRLEVDCIRPLISGISSLQPQNGTELLSRLTGRLRIRGDRNIRLRVETEEDADPTIVIDAISGVGLTEDCVCDDGAGPIYTVSLVSPDSQGNLNVLGSECLEITAGQNALHLRNRCAESCCGSEELDLLRQQMELVLKSTTTMETFMVNLEARVTNADLNLLSSRLGDRGCVPGPDCP